MMKLALLTRPGIDLASVPTEAGEEPSDRELCRRPHQLAGREGCLRKMRPHHDHRQGEDQQEWREAEVLQIVPEDPQKTCTGPKVTIYAEDLENMAYECVSAKLAGLEEMNRAARKGNTAEVNELKLKLKAIEKSEKQLLDTILSSLG